MTVKELFDSSIDFSWNDMIVFYYEKFPARCITYEIPESFKGYQDIVSQACKDKFATYLNLPVDTICAQKRNDEISVLIISIL